MWGFAGEVMLLDHKDMHFLLIVATWNLVLVSVYVYDIYYVKNNILLSIANWSFMMSSDYIHKQM